MYAAQMPARGATEGPLATLIPVFIDVEMSMVKKVSDLSSCTLRQYLAAEHLTSMAVAIGTDEPNVYEFPHGKLAEADAPLLDVLDELAGDPRYVFVAHNASFDVRVLRFKLGIQQPINVWCTLEGAMGAWPELPGGYKLSNICDRLKFPETLKKLHIDIEHCTTDELLIYNKRDVLATQELYYRQIALLPAVEQEVALRTHRVRQFHFEIDQTNLDRLMTELVKQADYAEKEAEQYVTADEKKDIFNRDDGDLRSVRSKRLLNVINNKGSGLFASTSLKKISPIKLAQAPTVAALLAQTSRVAKMLSHKRRSAVFKGVGEVDLELGYMRAHTGRFSSPSTGKGLNLHNIPKHDKAIAKPVREIFRLPKDLCFVRADLANVEYRVEGKLTNCSTVKRMFDTELGGNPFNDPYCLAWKAMTGQSITKKSPIRQVAKAAVLGLGFSMGATKYASGSLLPALADKKSGVTEDELRKIAIELGWRMPEGEAVARIVRDTGCSSIVALASYHIHKAFNQAHPEFGRTADWFVRAVTAVASCGSKEAAKKTLESMYNQSDAPAFSMIGLEIDNDATFDAPSVRVRCGDWPATVCWREPKVRPTKFIGGPSDPRLTILKANGHWKPFIKQLAIENVTQAAARNGLCWAVAELDKRGFPYICHVHDEIMIIVPRQREAVLTAKQAMIDVVGPQGVHPMGWAVMVKPEEITVTESMWESEEDITTGKRWERIVNNAADCLDSLP